MVIDAALAHRIERLYDRVAVRRLAGALPGAPKEFEDPGLREFGGSADAAVQLVDLPKQALGDRIELGSGDRAAALRAPELLQRLTQRDDVLGDLVAVLHVGIAHRFEDLWKTGPAPALLWREVGAAPEGLAVG